VLNKEDESEEEEAENKSVKERNRKERKGEGKVVCFFDLNNANHPTHRSMDRWSI
jgi:hypothetical protein